VTVLCSIRISWSTSLHISYAAKGIVWVQLRLITWCIYLFSYFFCARVESTNDVKKEKQEDA